MPARTRQGLILAAIALVVVTVGVPMARSWFASPETKIRWRLERMAKDFSLGRPGPCTRGLTDDFRDETSGAETQDIRAILARMSFSEREKDTNRFLYRVTLPPEEMTIVVEPVDRARAHVDLLAVFEKFAKAEWHLDWRVAISADLVEGDDGWQVRRSSHETVEGERPR